MEAIKYTVNTDINRVSDEIVIVKRDIRKCTNKINKIALNKNLTDLEYRRTSFGRSLLNIDKTYKSINKHI